MHSNAFSATYLGIQNNCWVWNIISYRSEGYPIKTEDTISKPNHPNEFPTFQKLVNMGTIVSEEPPSGRHEMTQGVGKRDKERATDHTCPSFLPLEKLKRRWMYIIFYKAVSFKRILQFKNGMWWSSI